MILSSKSNITGIYVLKVNNKNTRTKWKICSKSTIKTTVWQQLTSQKITPLILIKCSKNIDRRTLNMSITVEFLDTGEKVLLNGGTVFFIFIIPFHPTHSRSLIYLKTKKVMKKFSVEREYEVVSICYCWIMPLTLYKREC